MDAPLSARALRPSRGHALLVYASSAQRAQVVADWTVHGLVSGEAVLLVGYRPLESHELLRLLARHELRIESLLASRRLRFLRADELDHPQQARTLVAPAADARWQGVRLSGSTNSAFAVASPRHSAALEEELDRLCDEYRLSVLCLAEAATTGPPLGLTRHPTVLDDTGLVTVRSESNGGPPHVVVELAGEFDSSNASLLRGRLTVAVRWAGPDGALTLDVQRLRFLSVSAARAVLEETCVLRREAGRVRLRGVPHELARVLAALDLRPGTGFALVEPGAEATEADDEGTPPDLPVTEAT